MKLKTQILVVGVWFIGIGTGISMTYYSLPPHVIVAGELLSIAIGGFMMFILVIFHEMAS